ncbi:MAG: GapR family DNA-binding domain-containing protein [Saprospiraceae bacterium]
MQLVYRHVQRLEGLRKQRATAVRDELRQAKETTEVLPASIREAARLGRMKPERREKWEQRLNGALRLMGYTEFTLDDNPPSPQGNAAATHKRRVEELEAERKKYGDEIAGWYKAAKERGLDVAALRLFVRMGRAAEAIDIRDAAVEIGEWFEGVETTGKQLGVLQHLQ